MPFRHHPHDLVLARAKLNPTAPDPPHAHEKIAHAVNLCIDQNLFRRVCRAIHRTSSLIDRLNQFSEGADHSIDTIVGRG
jgi:hypothetical protein